MAREFSKPFYNSKEWERTRIYCLMRDRYTCQDCGRPAQEVHHKKHLSPENIGDVSVTLNPDNLVSLCRDCHFARHRNDQTAGKRSANVLPEIAFDQNGNAVVIPPGRNFPDGGAETAGRPNSHYG